MFSIQNKNVLITGGTSGIGLAVARHCVQQGARVVITGRRESGEAIAAEIGATFLRCDVSEEQQTKEMLAAAEQTLGKLDGLVLNAGFIGPQGSLEASDTTEARRTLDINIMGVYYGLKYGPEHLKDGGSILITGSNAGSGITAFGFGAYAASKAGAAYLARTAAIELGPRAIRVNVVAPGTIAAGMNEGVDAATEAALGRLSALGRWGTLDEVVGVFHFLLSDAATYITGQEIRVDGGATAGISLPVLEKLMG